MDASGEPAPGGRRSPATALAVFALGVLLVVQGVRGDGPPQPVGGGVVGAPGVTAPPLAGSPPTRLVAGRIDVSSAVRGVGLDEYGSVAVPSGAGGGAEVGWYEGGVTPGEAGTAVLVGHVDDESGPAVFHDLGHLLPGHTVEVRREDGLRAVFTVHAVKVFAGANFPDSQVYGSTGRPELRLITCGGVWTSRDRYSGNTVVFAHLTGTR